MTTEKRNNRIAKNTLMLYFRQILILFVSLYTVRIILGVLGVEDYGIYGAVGGLVALSAFLPGSLAMATQRFFSFSLGEKNTEKLNKTFSVNLILYIGVAVVAFLLFQTIGLWFVNSQLVVPDERFDAAKSLYFFSCITFILSVFTTPFMAIIMAHEDMKAYAYISIFEALLKLSVVYLLQYISWDKLELYGLLVMCVGLINALMYIGFCLHKYDECQFKRFYWDLTVFKEILNFTGWTFFGQISTVARTHAVTLLLNQMFIPAVVAARAISVQIASQVNIFSNNFNASLTPPIVKSYAANERQEMFYLIIAGSKATFFLLWVFALPMILEMETILGLWLTTVPSDAVLFGRLALIESLIMSISMPLSAAARAPGKMKSYELSLGLVQIGIFIVAWIILAKGAPAYSVFIVAIVANILMFAVRLYILKCLIALPIMLFVKKTLLPVIHIILASCIPILLLIELLPNGFYWSVLIVIISFILSSFVMYFIGLNKEWRLKIKNIVFVRVSRLLN